MSHLDSHSYQLILAALAELHSDADPSTLADRAVNAAMKLVECDLLTFDFFSKSPRYEDTAWSNAPELLNPEFMSVFGEYLHQHPTVQYSFAKPDGQAMTLTDVVSQTEFERTDLYNLVYRQVHVNKQMGCGLLSEGDLLMTYAFTRKGSDFTDREKAIVTAAAPHFVNAIRNGFAFRRISDAMAAGGAGVIAIDSRGKLTFASSFAQILLERYFHGDLLASDSLPATLSSWLGTARIGRVSPEYGLPPEPFRAEGIDGSRLTIRLLDNRSNREELLLLEERRAIHPEDFRPFGLTPRECEVLYWITEGKTDPDISILLDLSIRTVEKHVENIYRKLGVETRTAALSAAYGIIH